MRVYVLAAVMFALLGISANDASGVTLVKDSQSNYIIMVADRAIEPERTAATELQSYLKQITGAELPIVRESRVDAFAPRIMVGQTARTKKLLSGLNWK